MVRSLDSSVSSLDISRTEHRPSNSQAQPAPKVGLIVTEPSLVSARRYSMSDTDSIFSRSSLPAQNSAAELSGSSNVPECTCICPATGTPLGPPCRTCRAASYNMLQQEQARRTRLRNRLRSVTSSLSSKMSVFSDVCHWSRKRKRPSAQSDNESRRQGLHRNKDSVVSWPDSECTFLPDEQIENVKPHKNNGLVVSIDCSSHKPSLCSGNGLLKRKDTHRGEFLRIPDTYEEKAARKEEERRRIAKSYRPETGSVDYWHDEYGMIDWRVVWAMSAIC